MKVARFPAEMNLVQAEASVSPDAIFVPHNFIHKTTQAVMKYTTVREIEEITSTNSHRSHRAYLL